MTPPLVLTPRPGELLYSAFARQSDALGPIGPKAVMQALFGRPGVVSTMDLPNNLARLTARMPDTAALDVKRLASQHTLFPYYTRFQPPAVRDRAMRAMAGSSGSVHVMLGISTFRTGRPAHLQFCPDCLADMLVRFGTPHWRAVHQLPGVLVCPDHHVILRRSDVVLGSCNRHEFIAASGANCPVDGPPVTAPLDRQATELAVLLSRASAVILSEGASGSRQDLRAEYQAELRRAGLMRGRSHVDQGELARRFQQYWGGLLARLEGVELEGRGETWLASLVRSSSGAQPPLQHLLLRIFLAAQPDVEARPLRAYAPRHRAPNLTGSSRWCVRGAIGGASTSPMPQGCAREQPASAASSRRPGSRSPPSSACSDGGTGWSSAGPSCHCHAAPHQC